MKFFICYRFRNSSNKTVLKERLTIISELLEKRGHKTYIHWRDDQNWKTNLSGQKPINIISKAFAKIYESDFILAFVESGKTSEGMLLELGYGYALQKKILLAYSGILPPKYLTAIANKFINFTNFKTLINSLDKINFEEIK